MKKNVCKICRRAGEKLFLKGERCVSQKCAMIKRNYAPGIHGQKPKRGGFSEYGQQLRAKQIDKYKGHENSLANQVYEKKLASSLQAAKQLISHGKVLVNNKKITIATYKIREKDLPAGRQGIIKLKK